VLKSLKEEEKERVGIRWKGTIKGTTFYRGNRKFLALNVPKPGLLILLA
jgi:hypothetical protein